MFVEIRKKIQNPSILFLSSIFLLLAIYQSTILKLVKFWLSNENSHSFLLVIVCIYLFHKIWKNQKKHLVITVNVSAYVVLFLLSLIWLFANLTFVKYVELVSLPIILTVLLAGLLGWNASRVYWFPFLLMLLGGPLLSLFIPLLQDVTASMTGLLLDISGVTSMVDGVLILVPAGTFEVDAGCSGLNVLTVGVILSLLYAYINRFNLKGSLLLLVAGTLVSILSNIIRVYIIVVVGNATKMQHSLVEEHGNLGWAVFLLVMGMFLYLVHRYWHVSALLTNNEEHLSTKNTVGETQKKPVKNYLYGPLWVLLFAGIGPLLFFYSHIQENKEYMNKTYTYKIQQQWQIIENATPAWEPVYKAGKGDYLFSQTFMNHEHYMVYLDIRYFLQQTDGNEAINITNSVYDRSRWTRVWIKLHSIKNIAGLDEVEETLIRGKNNQEILVWRWYITNGRKTGNPYKAKLYNLLGVLTGKPEIATYIIAADVKDTYGNSRGSLNNFINVTNNVYLQ